MQEVIDSKNLDDFLRYLLEEGKSKNTVKKYLCDVKQFIDFMKQCDRTDYDVELLGEYRRYLEVSYQISSANSKISAINSYLKSRNYPGQGMKYFRVQKAGFRPDERHLTREEYQRLLRSAKETHNKRLCLAMQTIAATGIRISELQFVTVESLNTEEITIDLKGKIRKVLLPDKLCKVLAAYAKERRIRSGPIFVTQSGKPIDRSNLLHSMKSLCDRAEVDSRKVFPHNLRHLFAVTYYENQKDVCHLADILGHSDVNTTRIYTIMSSRDYRQKIEDLGLLQEE